MGIITEIFTIILGAAFMFAVATIISIPLENYYFKRKAAREKKEKGGGITIIK